MIQKLRALRMGKAMRRLPICDGRMRLPKAGLRRRGEDEEQHQGAVEGDEGEVLFREDGSRKGEVRVNEVEAHQEGHDGPDGYGDEGEQEVLAAYGAVVGKGREQGPGFRVQLAGLRPADGVCGAT